MINTPGTKSPLLIVGDTDALIALLHEEDAHFSKAKTIVQYLAAQDAQFVFPVTTLTETLTTFTRKLNKPDLAAQIVEYVKRGSLVVEGSDEAVFADALEIFKPTASKKKTIFDACVAATAKKLHTPYIFSFDNWYTSLGLTLAQELLK